METLCITGGKPLRGTLAVQGSKNAVLPLLAAAAAVPGRSVLLGCPSIRDLRVSCALLEGLGLSCRAAGDTLFIDAAAPPRTSEQTPFQQISTATPATISPMNAVTTAQSSIESDRPSDSMDTPDEPVPETPLM